MGEKVAPHDETAWDIEWDIAPVGRAASLRIVSAKFSWKDANGQPRSIVVVKNLQLVEAFSQYDDGETTFLDIDAVGLKQIPASEDFLGPACVGQGEVLKSKHLPHDKKVHKELHYDGLRWMSVYGGHRGKRGEKLILWSAVASANYIYLMEYNFTDDGRIVCRLGFTAHNYFNRSKDLGQRNRTDNKDVHAHVGCWRWDFDLSDPVRNMGGAEFNNIKIVRRVNDLAANRFRIDVIPFPGTNNGEATEGKAKWIAKDFTTLRAVSSVLKNTRGEPISYDLISTRTGVCDGLRPVYQAAKSDMDFANYDFHVTLRPTQSVAFHKVPELSARSQPLKGKATTIWYSVPGLHVPRDEDFGNGGQNAARGAAMTEWVSFTLRPRDLFDSTPGYRAE
jgi:Cu2+-containing amine oxidase